MPAKSRTTTRKSAERKAEKALKKASKKKVEETVIEDSEQSIELKEDGSAPDTPTKSPAKPVVTNSWAKSAEEQHRFIEEQHRGHPEAPHEDDDGGMLPVPADSIANFDRKVAAEYEHQKAGELGIDQLLKLLIYRGERQFNPALAKSAEKLLRQLNRETIYPPKRSRPRNSGGPRRRGPRPAARGPWTKEE